MTIAIQTSETRRKALRETIDGIGRGPAEILQTLGLDPRDWAAEIRRRRAERVAMGSPRAARRASDVLATLTPPPGATPLSLDPSDVTQRTLLNEVALESIEETFLADVIAPVQLVDLRSGRQYVASRTANRAEVDDHMGERARATRIPSGLSQVDYDCEPFGLESDVNEQLAGEHPLLENVSYETRRVGTAVHLQQELRVCGPSGALFTAGNYAAANVQALGAGFNWNGGASANPISDMNDALAAMTVVPTHLVMSQEVLQAAQENDDLRAILAAGHEGLIGAEEFAMYWGIANALVSRGQYAATATPTTMTRILSTTALAMVHANGSPRARTFLRQYRLRQGARGIVTTTRFDASIGVSGFTVIKVAHQTDLVVVDNRYGALITGVRA